MIEKELKELILKEYSSVSKFAKACDLPLSTVATILNRGVANSNVGNLCKICSCLGISMDALCENRIKPKGETIATNTTAVEISQLCCQMHNCVGKAETVTIDRKPATKEQIRRFLDTMRLCAAFCRAASPQLPTQS